MRKLKIDANLILSITILAAGLLISGFLVAQALTADDIVYPVAELGNCKNEADCRTYCDKPENMKPCISFAEKYNLLSKEELQQAKKFDAIGEGPGGCKTESACEAYCDDIVHMDECIAFAEKHGIIPPEELAEAKKVQAAIKRGVKPPPCGNKKSCDAYCQEPDHMEECIAFGEAAGFIPPEELKDAKKMLEAVKKGAKPPPCKGKAECDAYCSAPEHMEVCMEFAIAAGFVSQDEAKEMEKVLSAIKKGAKPPPCKGKNECDKWCEESDANMAQCIDFAIAAGFMSEKDAEMARKTGGKGPGGCRGKEECDAFCDDPANQETCFNFAKEHGLIPEEDLRQMEEGKQHMMEGFNNAPPEVMECLASKIGPELIEKMKAGTAMPSREMGELMRACFEQMMPPPPAGGPGMPGGPGIGPAAGTKVILKQKSGSQFEVVVINPVGIEVFSFQPVTGSHYGGGLPGCPKEWKTTTVFDPVGFPLKVVITDCQGNVDELEVPSAGEYSVGGGPSGGTMPPEGGVPPSVLDIQTMPPQVLECLKKVVGEENLEKVKSGQMAPSLTIMKSCFEQAGIMPAGPSVPPGGSDILEGLLGPEGMCDFNKDGKVDDYEKQKCGEGQMAPPAGMEGMMPPQPPQGQLPPEGFIPTGQYGPEQYTPPTGPAAGGEIAPGELGPAPDSGTAPPTEITPPPPPEESTETPPSSLTPLENMIATLISPFVYIFLGR